MGEEKKRLEHMIKRLKAGLQGMPEGSFYTVKNGNYMKWFVSLQGKKILIPKADTEYAKTMAKKKMVSGSPEAIRTGTGGSQSVSA